MQLHLQPFFVKKKKKKKSLQANKNAIIYPYNQGWLSPSTQPNSSWWGKTTTKPALRVGNTLETQPWARIRKTQG